ncbi:cation transporter [Labilibaculum sp. K2S]|uniref:cation transporter n=1 Tax=Labilibaculum sp. K2S TaxID=3056386 RepID=UPI0025A3A91C|nr:cation transporter [Labilibaculum sp. K2S]MDM8158994.1 cation transporter [Labilibaculum sp. K2S]
MKQILIVVFAIACLAACQSNTKKAESNSKAETTQVVDYETMEFTVTGMTCTGCENTIKNGLKQIDGVVEVEASHTNNKVSIKVEKDKVNRDEIAQQIEAIGYNVEK